MSQRPAKTQRELSIDFLLDKAVEEWMVNDYGEASRHFDLAFQYNQMSDNDFQKRYNPQTKKE